MNLNDDGLDLTDFVNNLSAKTKSSEIQWKKVNKMFYDRIIDRPIPASDIRDCYYSDSPNGGRVVIGKFQNKKYVEEDEYYLEDHFFISITNGKFEDPTSFLESDDALGFSFTIILSKLHRLIKLNINDIKNRIDNWF